ncbi:hypothetical protein D3C72_2599590 [compost metagenome]
MKRHRDFGIHVAKPVKQSGFFPWVDAAIPRRIVEGTLHIAHRVDDTCAPFPTRDLEH